MQETITLIVKFIFFAVIINRLMTLADKYAQLFDKYTHLEEKVESLLSHLSVNPHDDKASRGRSTPTSDNTSFVGDKDAPSSGALRGRNGTQVDKEITNDIKALSDLIAQIKKI